MRNRWWAVPLLAAAVIGLAACGSSSGSSSTTPAAGGSSASATSGSQIKTASTSLGTILVNPAGHAIYWFGPDSLTKSACTGSCTTYWPPVTGPVTTAAGVSLPGEFGTIKRADGTTQATYEGHPLYTYAADGAAGQVSGNGLNVSGGLWWAMTPSGAKVKTGAGPAAQPSTSTNTGGYGY